MFFLKAHHERPFLLKGHNYLVIKRQVYSGLIDYQKQLVSRINTHLLAHRLDFSSDLSDLVCFGFLNDKCQFELDKAG